jgi:plasmid stabilization system protein ParE
MAAGVRPVRLEIDAQAELQDSINFYNERGGSRLADRFKQRIKEGFEAIAANPERFRRDAKNPDIHWYRAQQFPFSILYIVRPDHILIVALPHGRRRPGYWRDRLK